jgi:hypothetical protein
MGSFGRSLKRGVAKNMGLLRSRSQVVRAATKARRMWCPKCQLLCDSWNELVWSQPNDKNTKTLLCARCGTPVESKSLFELPQGTPEKGLWLKPGPGGWGFHERHVAEAREAAEAEVVAAATATAVGEEKL